MKHIILLLFQTLFFSIQLLAQTFNLPAEVCPGENITFTSPQPNAPKHEWDFCTGDLLQTPEAALMVNPIVGIARPEGIEIVNDGNNWYGFVTARNSNNIVRLNFGNSLDNTPDVVAISLTSLNGPIGIRVLKEGTTWYMFIVNVNNNTISKFSLGNNLLNVPAPLGIITDPSFVFPCRIDFLIDRVTNKKYAYVTNYGTTLTILDFDTSIDNIPTSYATPNLGVSGLIGISALEYNNQYYAIVCGDGGTVRLLSFGTNPLNTNPTGTNIHSSNNPIDIAMKVDADKVVVYGTSINGNIVRNVFDNFPNPTVQTTNLGNFGILGTQNLSNRPTLSASLVQENSTWYLFAINRHPNLNPPFNQHQLVRLKFPNNCNANIATSTEKNPTMNYVLPGNYIINLRTFDADGNLDKTYHDQITVKQATVGNFTFTNQCLGETTIFNNISIGSDANVSQWEWDFGDGSPKSNLRNPTYKYSNAGTFPVSLKVTNTTGCVNTTTKTIVISDRPKADFKIEIGTCLGEPVKFTDLSSWNPNTPVITYRWDFGDGIGLLIGNASDVNTRNPSYIYNIPGTYNVTLSLFEGNPTNCAGTITRQITIAPAPVANFTFSNLCANAPTQFIDTSTLVGNWGDAITHWHWNFSGRGTSNERNPRFIFTETGTFNVTLTVTTQYGCQHTTTKSFFIQPSAVSSFTNPITAGNAPLTVRFTNTSTGATSFLWEFGDGGTSTEASPTYTFNRQGVFTVGFQARGTNGCGSLVTQTITVFAPLLNIALTNLQINEQGQMTLTIQNKSSFPLTETNFQIKIGNNDIVNEIWRGFIGPNQEQTITLMRTITPEQRQENPFICVTAFKVNQLEDTDVSDNTTCFKILKSFEILQFSPTPADKLITINYYIPDDSQPVELLVYNSIGALVRKYTLPVQIRDTNLYYFDTNALSNGVYYFHFVHKGKRIVKKAMIFK